MNSTSKVSQNFFKDLFLIFLEILSNSFFFFSSFISSISSSNCFIDILRYIQLEARRDRFVLRATLVAMGIK